MNKSPDVINDWVRYNVARWGVMRKGMSVSEYISGRQIMPEGATVETPFMDINVLNNGDGGNYLVAGKTGAGKTTLFPVSTGQGLSGQPHRFTFTPDGRENK